MRQQSAARVASHYDEGARNIRQCRKQEHEKGAEADARADTQALADDQAEGVYEVDAMPCTAARRIPAPNGHSRATDEPQHTVLEEGDDHHEAAEGDGAHVLPVNERVLKKLSVAAHVKADRSLHLVGNALKIRLNVVINKNATRLASNG